VFLKRCLNRETATLAERVTSDNLSPLVVDKWEAMQRI